MRKYRCLPIILLAAAAGCATVGTAPPGSGAVQRTVFTSVARSVAFFYYIDPGCTVRARPRIRIVRPPAHGTLRVVEAEGFPSFPESNVRFDCNKQRLPGTFLTYQSNADFTGFDVAGIEILYVTGAVGEVTYAINVLPIPEKIFGARPGYPEAARQMQVEGEVVVWLHVDAEGNVSRVEIKQSPDESLSEEARSTLGRWKFRPADGDKSAFPYTAEYRIVFRLLDPAPSIAPR